MRCHFQPSVHEKQARFHRLVLRGSQRSRNLGLSVSGFYNVLGECSQTGWCFDEMAAVYFLLLPLLRLVFVLPLLYVTVVAAFYVSVFFVQCCFRSTETVWSTSDGEPTMSLCSFTRLLCSDVSSSSSSSFAFMLHHQGRLSFDWHLQINDVANSFAWMLHQQRRPGFDWHLQINNVANYFVLR